MIVYVAGKFEEQARVREVMAILDRYGHQIALDWTTHNANVDPNMGLSENALLDLGGVKRSDVLIAIMEKPLPYAGAWGEVCAALVLGIPVYISGGDERDIVFGYHPGVQSLYDFPDQRVVAEIRRGQPWQS